VTTTLVDDTCDSFANFTTTGSPTIVAGLHGNCFNFPIGSSNRVKYLVAGAQRSADFTIGFNVRFGALITHDFLVMYTDIGTNNQSTLRLNPNGSISIFSPPSTTHGSSAAGSIAVNTWYYVEAFFRISNTVGIVELRINGTQIFRATNQDTEGIVSFGLYDQIWWQSIGGAGSAAWQVDDIYINNGQQFGTAPPPAFVVATADMAITFTATAVVHLPIPAGITTTFDFTANADATHYSNVPATITTALVGFTSVTATVDHRPTIATRFNFAATAIVFHLADMCDEPLGPTEGVPMGIDGYDGWRFGVQIAVASLGSLLGSMMLGTGVLGGPRWLDVTNKVEGLHWTRGGEPAQRPIAGELTFRLNNDDKQWSPWKSSFYGPGTMCRLVVSDGVDVLNQFCGQTVVWNEAGAGLGAYEFVDITVWENMFLLSGVNDHALAGVVGGGDTLTQRIDRLLTQAAWAFKRVIMSAVAATFQASNFPRDVASEVYLTVDSVDCVIWPGKDGMLMIADRAMGSGAHWTLPTADQNTDSIVTANDDERILSSVDLARVGGTSVTYTNTGLAGKYQRRSTQRTDLITNAEAGDADLARVANGMLTRARQTYRPVQFSVESGQGANQAQLIIESDITDRISLDHDVITFSDYSICGVEHDVTVAAAGIYWRATFSLDIEADSTWSVT
jgi:hypothetical protein